MAEFGTGRERARRALQSALLGGVQGIERGATAESVHDQLKSDARAMKSGKSPLLGIEEVAALSETFPKAVKKWLKRNRDRHGGLH